MNRCSRRIDGARSRKEALIPRSDRIVVLWWAAFEVVLAAAVGAETLHPAGSESTAAATIEIDFLVVDADGRAVEGLTREDFAVYEGKVERHVRGFAGPVPSRGTRSDAAASGIHVAFLIDERDLLRPQRDLVLRRARPFLRQRIAAGDRVSVLSYAERLEVLVALTTDLVALETALDELAVRGSRSPTPGLLLDAESASRPDTNALTGLAESLLAISGIRARTVLLFAAPRLVLRGDAPPSRRALVLSVPGTELGTTPTPTVQYLVSLPPLQEAASRERFDDSIELAAFAQTRDIAVYPIPIDVTKSGARGGGAPESDLLHLASASGGDLLPLTALERRLSDVSQRLDVRYSLSYQTSASDRRSRRQLRKVRVTLDDQVARRGLRVVGPVVSRREAEPPSPISELAERTLSALYLAAEDNSLDIELALEGPIPRRSGIQNLTFGIQLPPAPAGGRSNGESAPTPLAVALVTLDRYGRLGPIELRTLTITGVPPPLPGRAPTSAVRQSFTVEIPDDVDALALGVLDAATGVMSVFRRAVGSEH